MSYSPKFWTTTPNSLLTIKTSDESWNDSRPIRGPLHWDWRRQDLDLPTSESCTSLSYLVQEINSLLPYKAVWPRIKVTRPKLIKLSLGVSSNQDYHVTHQICWNLVQKRPLWPLTLTFKDIKGQGHRTWPKKKGNT